MTRTHLALVVLTATSCVADKPGTVDSDGIQQSPLDEDGDGYDSSEDCDDADASVRPGAVEICDGVDNDCDDQIDEDVLVCGENDGFIDLISISSLEVIVGRRFESIGHIYNL